MADATPLSIEEMEPHVLRTRGRVESDRNRYQPERQGARPHSPRHVATLPGEQDLSLHHPGTQRFVMVPSHLLRRLRKCVVQHTWVSRWHRRGGSPLRFGRWEIQPLGGGVGCLMMILISVMASIALTVLLNVLTGG
jgi:hypothetical protein